MSVSDFRRGKSGDCVFVLSWSMGVTGCLREWFSVYNCVFCLLRYGGVYVFHVCFDSCLG